MSFGGGSSGSGSIGTSSDVALSNPATGQALLYDSSTAKWKNGTVSSSSSPTIATLPPGSTITVRKDSSTGFWPASYDSSGAPVYTSGSASSGVRPTSRTDIICIWVGSDPSPSIVSSGTAGMLSNVDLRMVTS